MSLRTRFIGCGSYLPENIVTNQELAKSVDTSDEWITARTGIKRRHIAAEGEYTSDLARQAAVAALDSAGLKPNDLDLIIVGTTTSATIEGWAQTALATVDHIATTDNMLFIMYDNGAIASTAAIFEFTADGTATDIAAAELQLVAVADVTQDTMTFDNIL